MTHQEQVSGVHAALESMTAAGFDGMANAIRILVNEAMKLERSEFLGARPHERSESRRGYANGYKPKTVATRVGAIEFEVPQVRGVEDGSGFYPSALEKGLRSERALKLAVAEMYINGVSTRKVEAITEKLCGLRITSMEVSRATALLDEELTSWRDRPLGKYRYVVLDARYEKVRHGGCVVSSAVLVALGVDESGHRAVLGVSVSRSESEVHWREFLESLRERGLHGVELFVSDSHSGLRAAMKSVFVGAPWQRCQFHLQQNASTRVPKVAMRPAVARAIRAIFNAPTRQEAERLLANFAREHEESAPDLASWALENVPECFTVFSVPAHHHRKLRTSNSIERLNREIKRRTRVATLFPNDASLLRLTTAVVMETTEDWESGRRYLTMTEEA